MPKVTIRSIKRQSIMSDSDWAYLQARLNAPLQLMSISWWRSTNRVSTFAVYAGDSVITVFPDEQLVDFEVDFNG